MTAVSISPVRLQAVLLLPRPSSHRKAILALNAVFEQPVQRGPLKGISWGFAACRDKEFSSLSIPNHVGVRALTQAAQLPAGAPRSSRYLPTFSCTNQSLPWFANSTFSKWLLFWVAPSLSLIVMLGEPLRQWHSFSFIITTVIIGGT